jgi:methyltransferase (TIGR00027 family)
MREGRPSLTAAAVAWARAIGSEASPPDPTAAAFVSKAVDRIVRRAPAPARLLSRVCSLGLVDHVNLRTRAIDRAVRTAVTDGCLQLVVLGAGLDGRAWRLDGLDDVAVYEVDHPSTQVLKQSRAVGVERRAARIVFVPVDFERQALRDELARAGHDAVRRTVWIWEGVTPYLPRAAIEATLADVAARSAAGSRLAMTYASPPIVPLGWSPLVRTAETAFALLGEPIRCVLRPDETERLLGASGFELLTDTDSSQWGHDLPLARTLGRTFRSERLVVAQRDDSTRTSS